MSEDSSLTPDNTKAVENIKATVGNGEAIMPKEASTNNDTDNNGGHSSEKPLENGKENEEDSKSGPPSSSTPITPKKESSVPTFMISDEETDHAGKKKPFGHYRGGSSTSQVRGSVRQMPYG